MVLINGDLLLRASHLVRSFGKKDRAFVAVEDVSLDVGAGQVHGLLGPNGAGKTTTVRMCATLLAPTSGEVWVDGIDAVRHPERARSRLGLVLGGELGFYPRATARDNLLFFADIQGLDARRRHSAVMDALERVGLVEAASRKAASCLEGCGSVCTWLGRCSGRRLFCCWMSPPPAWTRTWRCRYAIWCVSWRSGERGCY